jgi:hypothetical protein
VSYPDGERSHVWSKLQAARTGLLNPRERGAPPGRSWPPRGALLQEAPSRPALPTKKKAPQRVVGGPLRKGMSFSRYGFTDQYARHSSSGGTTSGNGWRSRTRRVASIPRLV